jgi:hypothetical protein
MTVPETVDVVATYRASYSEYGDSVPLLSFSLLIDATVPKNPADMCSATGINASQKVRTHSLLGTLLYGSKPFLALHEIVRCTFALCTFAIC